MLLTFRVYKIQSQNEKREWEEKKCKQSYKVLELTCFCDQSYLCYSVATLKAKNNNLRKENINFLTKLFDILIFAD